MDMKKSIGQAMKRCRERTGMNLTEASYNSALYSEAICRYEKGQRSPGILAAIALADAYGVTLDELVGRNMET